MVRPLVFDIKSLLLDMLLDKQLEIPSPTMEQYHGEGQLHGLVELTQVEKKAETQCEMILMSLNGHRPRLKLPKTFLRFA